MRIRFMLSTVLYFLLFVKFIAVEKVYGRTVYGEIVYTLPGCDYFLISTSSGYTFAEWWGGALPMRGDLLFGELWSFGFKYFYNISQKRKMKVWIDDYWLSRTRAVEKIVDKCKLLW